MLIEHVALWAEDLERSRDFYTKYFNGMSNAKYTNASGFSSYFVSFSSGARLEIMSKPGAASEAAGRERLFGYSHMAFSAGGREKVDALTEALRAAGYKILSEPRFTGDGYYESCVSDPDGNRVEITE
jgi:lactoylglutathione lyase